MSLVGTRPILQDELLKYELHHRARIAIKPGITGMWQVSGRSSHRTKQGSDITRVLYFFIIGKKAVLTNGFIKKSQKTPKAEKELAKKYKADYERRYGNE